MTIEQLTKGNELISKIKDLKMNLEVWEKCDSFCFHSISLSVEKERSGEYRADLKYIDFDVLKKITIADLMKRLNQSTKEFENL